MERLLYWTLSPPEQCEWVIKYNRTCVTENPVNEHRRQVELIITTSLVSTTLATANV